MFKGMYYDPNPADSNGAGSGKSNAETGGQPGSSEASWYPPELASVGQRFKTPADALKSYAELEPQFTRSRQELAEERKFFEEHMQPIFGTRENYIAWYQAELAKRGKAGAGTGEEGEQPDAQQLVGNASREYQMKLMDQAQDLAIDQFLKANPDANDLIAEMVTLLPKYAIDPKTSHLASTHSSLLQMAYEQVKAGKMIKGQQGKQAGSAEGGGGIPALSDGDVSSMPLDKLRANLEARAGRG